MSRPLCSLYHTLPCSECLLMLKAATIVLNTGICSLCSLYKEFFPEVTYHTGNAKCRLLQMPMVAIKIQDISTRKSEILITELTEGVDYLKVSHFLDAHATNKKSCAPSMSKAELNKLLVLARSDRERELVK